MLFTILLIFGAVIGFVIALLGHPRIGGAVFGTRSKSDDHKVNEGL